MAHFCIHVDIKRLGPLNYLIFLIRANKWLRKVGNILTQHAQSILSSAQLPVQYSLSTEISFLQESLKLFSKKNLKYMCKYWLLFFAMESSINYIQLIFLTIAILTFLPGLITNYGEKYLPNVLVQFIRYGRANVAKDGKRPGILKLIEVPKK